MQVARKGVAIASSTKTAAEAGAAVASLGGNAVDAAIASSWVGAVTEPGICSPGCGGFVTIWGPDIDPVTIDGYIEMPGRGLPGDRFGGGTQEIFLEYGGGVTMHVGHGSVGTPGGPAALAVASERYGKLPWAATLEPSIALAREGFPLTPPAREYLEFSGTKVFGWHPDSRKALHHEDGSLLEVGDLIRVDHLADSLERLAIHGASDLYTGELASLITADMEANEGLITAADLDAYQPVVRDAHVGPVGHWSVATNPPPAVGGVVLGAMLRLMGEHPSNPWTRADVERLVEVQKRVLSYRHDHVDMREDMDVAISEMLTAFRSPSTVHTSAVDSNGLGCSITLSSGYGSGVMVPGTGLWLNNCLGEIELNRRGLHSWPVGARLVSNMAPTIARDVDGRMLSIGSPGADRITTAILQVFVNYATAGMTLAEAIDHPRLHVEHVEGAYRVAAEPGIPTGLGGLPWRSLPAMSMYFGGVGVAGWSPEWGLVAAADPRRSAGTAIAEL